LFKNNHGILAHKNAINMKKNTFGEFQMVQPLETSYASKAALQIDAKIRALPVLKTPAARAIRRQYSHQLKQADPTFILNLSRELIERHDQRWLAYEFIQNHQSTFQKIGKAELEELGQGINSWDTTDAFARILAGPAWLNGQVTDKLIHKWANSRDLWWRRAALVSTVALNKRSQGGKGDVIRTLTVCSLLVSDHEDMVAKAMSWALRELVVHDPGAVNEFLIEHKAELPARVKREVRNKLRTGLKNPKRKKD
jgi:3-methyladenine DNA glycosylase AlkD